MPRKHDPKMWPPPVPGKCNYRKRPKKVNGELVFGLCERYPLKGRERCKTHINHCKKGPDASNWKGGVSKHWARKYLPARMLERFDSVVNDPELTSVRELLGVVGARLTELYEKIPTQESGAAWKAMDSAFMQLNEALDGAEEYLPADMFDAVMQALDNARSNYRSASHEHSVWRDIFDVMDNARKLVETEQTHEKILQSNLTAQQSIALFNELFAIHAEEIKDADTRARVGTRLLAFLERDVPGFPLDDTLN